MSTFHKFPHTPHLLWLGSGDPRADKILSRTDAIEFLEEPVVVEEKIDGANLGISLDSNGVVRAQNRGNYINRAHCHPQWNALWPWLAAHETLFAELLGPELILFGEWCYARHSIAYNALPDWFLAFDVFDKGQDIFWSVDRRNTMAAAACVEVVPELYRGRISIDALPALIGTSKLGAQKMEGIYVRRETPIQLDARAKIVAKEFVQQIEEHWTRRPMLPNQRRTSAQAG